MKKNYWMITKLSALYYKKLNGACIGNQNVISLIIAQLDLFSQRGRLTLVTDAKLHAGRYLQLPVSAPTCLNKPAPILLAPAPTCLHLHQNSGGVRPRGNAGIHPGVTGSHRRNSQGRSQLVAGWTLLREVRVMESMGVRTQGKVISESSWIRGLPMLPFGYENRLVS